MYVLLCRMIFQKLICFSLSWDIIRQISLLIIKRERNKTTYFFFFSFSPSLLVLTILLIVISSSTYNHIYIFYIDVSSIYRELSTYTCISVHRYTLFLDILDDILTLFLPWNELTNRSIYRIKFLDMPIDKRKFANVSYHQNWFLSMYFSTHTLYLFLILISIAWNAYNAHQYQILAERQSKLENILTELLPSSSSQPLFHPEPPSLEQWFKKMLHSLRQFISKDSTNHDSIVQFYRVRKISDCLHWQNFLTFNDDFENIHSKVIGRLLNGRIVRS